MSSDLKILIGAMLVLVFALISWNWHKIMPLLVESEPEKPRPLEEHDRRVLEKLHAAILKHRTIVNTIVIAPNSMRFGETVFVFMTDLLGELVPQSIVVEIQEHDLFSIHAERLLASNGWLVRRSDTDMKVWAQPLKAKKTINISPTSTLSYYA